MKIISVPIDNRPCTMRFQQSLASIAGFDLILAPQSLLGHYVKPGNPEKIFEWLCAADADYAILSLEMLLYGGLIASRKINRKSVVEKRMERLKEFLNAKKIPVVCICSTITRTMPTFSSKLIFTLSENFKSAMNHIYEQNQEHPEQLWSALENVSLQNRELKKLISLSSEARKQHFHFNNLLLDWVKEKIINFAIIGLDDVITPGPNILERQMLEQRIREEKLENCFLYAGTDEMQLMALAKIACVHYNRRPAFSIHYNSLAGFTKPTLYEDRTISQSIDSMLRLVGCKQEKENGDIHLFCNALSFGQKEAEFQKSYPNLELDGFVSEIISLQKRNVNTAIADLAYANGADSRLAVKLLEARCFPKLYGYAAWNTAGNTLGTVIAHSIVKWFSTQKYEARHQQFLFERLLDDWLYESILRKRVKILCKIKGIEEFNLGERWDYFSDWIEERLKKKGGELFESAIAGTYEIKGNLIEIATPLEIKASLPWPRLFEIDVRCRFSVSEF